MDSRYWWVIFNKESHKNMDFFGVNEKLTCTRIPMGDYNKVPLSGVMMEVIQEEWKEETGKREILDFILEFIMDDIMIFSILLEVLLKYFQVVLDIIRHY